MPGLLLLFGMLWSCDKQDIEKAIPDCVVEKIEAIKAQPVYSPPGSVWEWKVDGKTYYYVTSDCCDQFNFLYDDECQEVCAPDGGFTGEGDGNCPEFNGQIEKTLIWEDERN